MSCPENSEEMNKIHSHFFLPQNCNGSIFFPLYLPFFNVFPRLPSGLDVEVAGI